MDDEADSEPWVWDAAQRHDQYYRKAFLSQVYRIDRTASSQSHQLPGTPTFESHTLVPGWSPVKKGTLFLSVGQRRAKAFEEALKEFSVRSCAEAVVQLIFNVSTYYSLDMVFNSISVTSDNGSEMRFLSPVLMSREEKGSITK
ncbi:hypothetical protein MG293_018090 [Ovis ammon polii]|uniref:Uncharacterized protein n=1 Tax=Ovis ammon polii TaxID=230172 RepID=A0AAD4TQW4_OVIAM|nr:hypothetical protein MG293_018090 [Ovis ammon polii]